MEKPLSARLLELSTSLHKGQEVSKSDVVDTMMEAANFIGNDLLKNERLQRQHDRDRWDIQKELVEKTYNGASAYANVIMIGGYAGFFAIWTLMKPEMSHVQVFWSALLITISLVCFIGWEVLAMFHRSKVLIGLARTAEDQATFVAKLDAYRSDMQQFTIKVLKWWARFLAVSAATAIGAVSILLYVFSRGLWLDYFGI